MYLIADTDSLKKWIAEKNNAGETPAQVAKNSNNDV